MDYKKEKRKKIEVKLSEPWINKEEGNFLDNWEKIRQEELKSFNQSKKENKPYENLTIEKLQEAMEAMDEMANFKPKKEPMIIHTGIGTFSSNPFESEISIEQFEEYMNGEHQVGFDINDCYIPKNHFTPSWVYKYEKQLILDDLENKPEYTKEEDKFFRNFLTYKSRTARSSHALFLVRLFADEDKLIKYKKDIITNYRKTKEYEK